MQKIKTVCVIGSGVMGSGIAAQVANSKTNVILLDIADKNSGDKNKIVNDSYNRLFTQKPPPLSHPDYAKYIKLGNLEDDLALVAQSDLIIEVIVERLDIKHQLYESISKYIKPTAVLASNTSTLPLAQLKEKLPAKIRENFVITHFFNPPRYMELVELVTDKETNEAIIAPLTNFITRSLGKTIVNCNDTPGFIANRVGCFLLELVVRRVIKEKLNPQTIDQIFSEQYGFPSTGIFGLYDLIGHDVMDLISKSLLSALPSDDKYHEIYQPSEVLDRMRTENLIGRKAGAGFYKISKDATGKAVKQVINFDDLGYALSTTNRHCEETKATKQSQEAGSNLVVSPGIATPSSMACNDDMYSNFVTNILQDFFTYVNSLIPSVTADKSNIDKAMKLGYSLKYGPFELMSLQENVIARSDSDVAISGDKRNASVVPHEIAAPSSRARNDGLTHGNDVIFSNESAELQLLNSNHIFVIKSKMNALNSDVFNLLIESVRYCEDKNSPMYIFPAGNNFSAGADLRYFKNMIESKNFKAIETLLLLGQKAMLALKYAKIPVVSCARGVALGGGCEILLHSSQVLAHQNLNAGLVEIGVGLIPAYGGTKEMFLRSGGDRTKLLQNLKNIITQNKSTSADYFSLDYGVECTITMNKDLILEEGFEYTSSLRGVQRTTKQSQDTRALLSPEIATAPLGPRNDGNAVSFDLLTNLAIPNPDPLQLDIIDFFQKIIDKKTVTEEQLLDLEREKFLELAAKPLALERISRFV